MALVKVLLQQKEAFPSMVPNEWKMFFPEILVHLTKNVEAIVEQQYATPVSSQNLFAEENPVVGVMD
jgi:hypothetical protein